MHFSCLTVLKALNLILHATVQVFISPQKQKIYTVKLMNVLKGFFKGNLFSPDGRRT